MNILATNVERHSSRISESKTRACTDQVFSFISGTSELQAKGLGRRIEAPAASSEGSALGLQAMIANAFDKARHAGQSNPIVVGAIPFDPEQPACLYVPETYHWQNRSATQVRSSAGRQAALLDQQDLPSENDFKKGVEQALERIHQGELHKAVLSVQRELTFAQAINLEALQEQLLAQNRQGYFFRLPLPDDATLIGVSPELLIRKQGALFSSNPLAGSAKRLDEPQADRHNAERLAASEKDLVEHSFVIQDITQQLDGICQWLAVPERPSLISTAALWHLSTLIEGELKAPCPTAFELACLLHPTPAVCGFPTAAAKHLIQTVEAFDRGLFTGTVGWCDAAGNGEWVVTIRCGTVQGQRIRLFAGAGIVEASTPTAEWAEVQTKLGTMLAACGLKP